MVFKVSMKQKKPNSTAQTSFKTRANDIVSSIVNFLSSKTFVYIIIGWFVFQAGFVAVTTSHSIPPDETAHLAQIAVYANDGWDPFITQQPGTYYLGALERTPNYLYHYVMSFPYRVIPNNWSPDAYVVTLRLVNIAFTAAGLVVFMRTLALLTKRKIVQNLTLFMMGNTLMFVFLSGALNYDNMFFFATSVAFYYLIKLLQKFSLLDLLKLSTAVAFALLVKFTFVPLAIMFAVALVVRYMRELPKVLDISKKEVTKQKKPLIIMSVVFLMFFGFFLERYAVNFVRYGSYRPKCEKVLTYEQCMRSALYRRNDTFRDKKPQNKIPEPEFVAKWMVRTHETVFGVMGHKLLNPSPVIRYGSMAIFGLMLIAVIRFVSKKDTLIIYLLTMSIVYVGVLIFHNHALFERSGIFGMALQGRYVFPILGILFFVGNYYVDRMLSKKQVLYVVYAAFVMVVFFVGSLPTFIAGPDSSWRLSAAQPIIANIQQVLRIFIP